MQKEFIIKAKKAVKKVAAVASGATLVASSMITPAMAASLADLPSPFVSSGVFDANIVVGTQTWNALVAGDPAGVASDLAGAIDVAAAFAQQATSSAGASGSVTLSKPITPGTLENSTAEPLPVGGSVDSNTPTANTFNATATGFDWMVNQTYDYNSSDYPIWEILTVDSGNIDSTGKFRSYGGVTYNITTNGSAVPDEFDQWPMFGENYQIISSGASKVRFGQVSTEKNVAFEEEVEIGDKARVVVSDWDTASSKAKVTITDSDGGVWVDDYYAEGKTFDNTTEGYTVTLKDVVISTIQGNHVDIEWSASSLSLKNSTNENNASTLLGESSPYANWTVDYDVQSDGLQWLSFTSPSLDSNGMVSLTPGEKIDGDYYNISFDGWKTNNDTTLTMGDLDGSTGGAELIYTNNESSTKNLNFDGVSDVWQSLASGGALNANKSNSVRLLTGSDVFQFQLRNASQVDSDLGGRSYNLTENAIAVWEGSSNIWNLTAYTIVGQDDTGNNGSLGCVACGMKPWGWARFNTSNAWYNISFDNTTFNISLLNWTAAHSNSYTGDSELGGEYFDNNLAWLTSDVHEFNSNGTMSGTLTLTEPTGKKVKVTVTEDAIKKVSSTDTGVGEVTSSNNEYTYYGTKVNVGSSDVQLTYPEDRRQSDLWIGREYTQTSSFSEGDTITGTDWTIAQGGTGGETINDISSGIGLTDQDVTFDSLSKPTILVGGAAVNQGVNQLAEEGTGIPAANLSSDRAYYQLVEDAFGSGQTVLVIAGYAAKDTQLACKVLTEKIVGNLNISITGNETWLDTSGSTYSQVNVVE